MYKNIYKFISVKHNFEKETLNLKVNEFKYRDDWQL